MDRWHRLQNDLFRDALLSAYDIFVVAWLHAVFLYASRLFFFFNGLLFFIDTSLDTLISAAAVGGFNLTGAEKKKKKETSAGEIIRAISLFCGILGYHHQPTNVKELEDSCVPSSKFSVVSFFLLFFLFCCFFTHIYVLSKSRFNFSFFGARHLFKFAALFLSTTEPLVSVMIDCARWLRG